MQPEQIIEFSASLEISTNKLWGAHFAIPSWAADFFADANDKRVVCTLNEITTYQCAMLPKGDGSWLITVNKKIRDQHKLKEGSRFSVKLVKDESEYGLPMPEEMAEVLVQDAEGNRIFHSLTPGKIRTLLYIAGQVKSSEKRIHRALAIIEHLKKNDGHIDFRQLNDDLKGS